MIADAWEDLEREIIACRRCPRLVAWREQVAREKRRAYRDWEYWGRPVPGFGDRKGRLLIVGLAPGAHGANRTGRMFTGDRSGETLFGALNRAGFANQPGSDHRDDGLALRDVYVTAAARCAPPKNRLLAEELASCQPFLIQEMSLLTRVRIILALGRVAFQACQRALRARGLSVPRLQFRHAGWYPLEDSGLILAACYHPSQQNTQTGRLTPEMLDEVFGRIRKTLEEG